MLLLFSAFVLPLLLVSAWAARSPPSQFIKLAYGVSQAAYSSGPLTDKDGHIWRNEQYIACNVKGWTGSRHNFRKTDETVVVFRHWIKRLAVIGFRGTDALTDWAYNIKIPVVQVCTYACRYNFGLHRGFYERYQHIRPWFKKEYDDLRRNGFKIIITGHSLGGAMATIAAAFAAGDLQSPPDAVITFASPKVGNLKFKRFYETMVGCDKTTNVEVQCDGIVESPTTRDYVKVCGAVSIKRGLIPIPLSCHELNGHYLTGLKAKYGERLQDAAQDCDQ